MIKECKNDKISQLFFFLLPPLLFLLTRPFFISLKTGFFFFFSPLFSSDWSWLVSDSTDQPAWYRTFHNCNLVGTLRRVQCGQYKHYQGEIWYITYVGLGIDFLRQVPSDYFHCILYLGLKLGGFLRRTKNQRKTTTGAKYLIYKTKSGNTK